MIFFLFVPTEGGSSEMAALEATSVESAVIEAQELEFAGRTGFLFDGDLFIREVQTANDLEAPGPALGS